MKSCEDRLVELASAAGGETPAGLDQHLASCDGCRAELALLRRTEALLRETAARPDDFSLSGFAYRVADRAEAFRDRSPRGLWWSLTRAMRLTMGFSASTLALAAVLFVGSRHVGVSPAAAARTPAVAIAASAPAAVATLGSTPVAPADDEIADEVDQMISSQRNQPDASLDSAFDGLSSDELDELAQQLETGSAG